MTVVKLCDGSKEHFPLPSSGRPLSEKFARFCKINSCFEELTLGAVWHYQLLELRGDLPSSRTAAEKRVCHRRTAARRLQPGVRECSLGSPSGRQQLVKLFRLSSGAHEYQSVWEWWTETKTQDELQTSLDFPLSVHIIMWFSETFQKTFKICKGNIRFTSV